VGAQQVQATTTKLGSVGFTYGRLGSETLNATTNYLGSVRTTYGTLGSSSFTGTTTRVGNSTFTRIYQQRRKDPP